MFALLSKVFHFYFNLISVVDNSNHPVDTFIIFIFWSVQELDDQTVNSCSWLGG